MELALNNSGETTVQTWTQGLTQVLVLPVVAALLAGCAIQAQPAEEETQAAALPVEVSAVREGSIAAYYSGSTTLQAREEALVVAKVEGIVTELLVEEGDFVKAGQVLARLDGERGRIELQRSQALMTRLENDLQRKEKMFEARLLSKEAFDLARYEYDANVAAHELASLSLEYAEIRTPIDGIVSQRLIKQGNLVTAYMPVFQVTAIDSLEAVLNVAQREIGTLVAGQTVNLRVRALGEAGFEGIVDRVSPTIDPDSGTFRVTVSVSDPNGRLRPGMFTRLNVEYAVRDNTVLAAKDAMMTQDGRTTVYIVEDGTAHRRVVELGYINGTEVEVLSGLDAGDKVVTAGYASLKDGSEVQIVGA